MEPVPTPFDITELPFIPFTPSLLLWILLPGTVLLVFLIILWLARRSPVIHAASRSETERRLRTLMQQKQKVDTQQAATATSLILKRFLSIELGESVDTLGTSELNALAASAEQTAPRRILLETLATLEESRYSGDLPTTRLMSLLERCCEALRQEEKQ